MDSSTLSGDRFRYLISEAASLLSAAPGAEHALAQSVDLVCRATEANAGCVLSSSEQSKCLTTNALWREGTVVPVDLTLPLEGTGAVSRAMQRREIQIVDRPGTRERLFQCLRKLQVQPPHSALIAPVLGDSQVLGAVLVTRAGEQPGFGSEQAVLLEAFASVLALGLLNTTLKSNVKTLSDRLSTADAQLLQSAKLAATGKLAASIAHEINNPLQSVQSCIYLVADGLTSGSPNRQYLDIAREEVDRIAKIIQRLADLYRPSQEGQRSVQLNTLLETVLALMTKRFQQSNVKVVAVLGSDLPPVTAVADQVKQVFFNLLLNAVEAMPEGGELSVSSQVVEKGQRCQVEVLVRDSGVGIAPEALGRIFDPFYTTKAKGTGLGLSISHDIVERHGGTIRVESRVGNGSAFVVALPVSGRSKAVSATR